MKNIAWLVVAGFAIGAVACGDSGSSTTTGGGGSGGDSAGGSNNGGENTGGNNGPGPGPGTGGAPACTGGVLEEPCDGCLVNSCCAEYAACEADAICVDCITGVSEDPACADNAAAADFVGCAQTTCEADCFPPNVNECNPITNDGCDAGAGEACDYSQTGFICYPEPNTLALCADCTGGTDFCAGGTTCATDGKCAKFCCDDGDCTAGSTCELDGQTGAGVCLTGEVSDCTAPLQSPSAGACVTVGG